MNWLTQPWPSWRIVLLKRWLEAMWKFSFRYGHWCSAMQKKPIINGRLAPWWNYPAIEFLDGLVQPGMNVLEYGSGSSSIWFLQHGCHVTSIESSMEWARKIRASAVNRGLDRNLELIVESDLEWYPRVPERIGHQYQIVVIDGELADGCRTRCARIGLRYLAYGESFAVLDNAEWCPYAVKEFRDTGLLCIPFKGFAPLIPYTTTTLVGLRSAHSLNLATGHLASLCSVPSPV